MDRKFKKQNRANRTDPSPQRLCKDLISCKGLSLHLRKQMIHPSKSRRIVAEPEWYFTHKKFFWSSLVIPNILCFLRWGKHTIYFGNISLGILNTWNLWTLKSLIIPPKTPHFKWGFAIYTHTTLSPQRKHILHFKFVNLLSHYFVSGNS